MNTTRPGMAEENAQPGMRDRFLTQYESVAEHSPWVAKAVWDNHEQRALDEDFDELADAFGDVIRQSSEEQRLELLRAHPDLACGIASDDELTGMSRNEQQGAGLDQCSPEEFDEFQRLNREYKAKFGFPFIIAVKAWAGTRFLNTSEAVSRDHAKRSLQLQWKWSFASSVLELKES